MNKNKTKTFLNNNNININMEMISIADRHFSRGRRRRRFCALTTANAISISTLFLSRVPAAVAAASTCASATDGCCARNAAHTRCQPSEVVAPGHRHMGTFGSVFEDFAPGHKQWVWITKWPLYQLIIIITDLVLLVVVACSDSYMMPIYIDWLFTLQLFLVWMWSDF